MRQPHHPRPWHRLPMLASPVVLVSRQRLARPLVRWRHCWCWCWRCLPLCAARCEARIAGLGPPLHGARWYGAWLRRLQGGGVGEAGSHMHVTMRGCAGVTRATDTRRTHMHNATKSAPVAPRRAVSCHTAGTPTRSHRTSRQPRTAAPRSDHTAQARHAAELNTSAPSNTVCAERSTESRNSPANLRGLLSQLIAPVAPLAHACKEGRVRSPEPPATAPTERTRAFAWTQD